MSRASIALPGAAFLVTALTVARALRPVIRTEVQDISAELEMDRDALVLYVSHVQSSPPRSLAWASRRK